MPLIYFVNDREDKIPVLTATTLEKVKQLLDEYMGLPPYFEDKDVEYLGYFPYNSKYGGDIFEGTYKYRDGNEIQEFGLYCMEIDALN
jgi:hypothetical protein